jgi:hypothetical protein
MQPSLNRVLETTCPRHRTGCPSLEPLHFLLTTASKVCKVLLLLDVCCINTRPATVGAQRAAPLLPEGDALAQDLRNGHLVATAPVMYGRSPVSRGP